METEERITSWHEDWEQRRKQLQAPHWSDEYESQLTTRAYHILKLSMATGPEHLRELGYEHWSRVPNCGSHTIREFEILFNGGAKFPRTPKEKDRPYVRASTEALLRELSYRGYAVKHVLECRTKKYIERK